MAEKLCVNLSFAKDNADKATVAFVIANAAAASGKEALVFLSTEGVWLSKKGYADDIHEAGFSPLRDLVASFLQAGGKIWACSPCCKKRGIAEGDLIPGAVIVGGAKLVEFLSGGTPSFSY